MAKLVFIGRLEDLAGAPELTVQLGQPAALSDVISRVPGGLASALTGPKVRAAVNGVVVADYGVTIEDTDEVAFLPPVSGG